MDPAPRLLSGVPTGVAAGTRVADNIARGSSPTDGLATPPAAPVRVAYVMNFYPAVAHTFILRELQALDPAYVEPFRVALNPVDAGDLLTDLERDEFAKTFNIRHLGRMRLAGMIVATVLRHPRAVLGAARVALAAAHSDVKLKIWHLLYLLEAIIVLRHCRRNKIRHLHAHLGQTPASVAWFVTEIGNRCRGERGTWTWSATIHGWHEFANEHEFALAEKVDAASFVVAISDFTRSQLMRIGDPSSWSKIDVVRCGLDLAKHPFVDRERAAASPTLVMTARLSPEKGHLVLLEAMHLLASRGTTVRARLIGDGPFRAEIERAVAAYGLGDHVELLGPLDQDDVRREVARADAFVLPTFAEGLPVVIMEAMAAGTPVVTTPIAGIPELVVDGVTGYLAAPGRSDELADAIGRLLADPDHVRIVTANARRAVEANHDVRVNVRSLQTLFTGRTRRSEPDERPSIVDERPRTPFAGTDPVSGSPITDERDDDPALRATVVVPVGRIDDLVQLQLDALAGQTVADFEVVLSLNSAKPADRQGLEALVAKQGDPRFRIVDSSTRRGAAHARNAGARAARAGVLAFCDADDIVAPDWLDEIVRALDGYDAVSGHLEEEELMPAGQQQWRPPSTPGRLPEFLGFPYLLSGNTAMRREVFEAAGGFDESMHRCEDIALGFSLQKKGYRIGYASGATIHYRHRASLIGLVQQHYHYGKGMSQVLVRYGLPADGPAADAQANGARPRRTGGVALLTPNRGGGLSPIRILRRGGTLAGRIVGLVEEKARSRTHD